MPNIPGAFPPYKVMNPIHEYFFVSSRNQMIVSTGWWANIPGIL